MGKVSMAHTEMEKGEVTVFLSLVFIILISFVGAMLESASIQNAKNYRRADVNRAMESVFAEYQKELLEEYDIFALEGSYETGSYSEQGVLDRLSYYGAGNMKHDIERIQFLTDRNCQTFYEQIAAYMEQKYGLTAMQDMLGTFAVWTGQEEKAKVYEQEEGDASDHLNSLLAENEGTLPEEGNPIAHTDKLRSTPVLELVCPRDMQISEKSMEPSGVLSNRQWNQGYGEFADEAKDTGALTKLLMGEYLLEHFSSAADQQITGVLDYELEYIIAGKASDRENLEKVAEKLLLMRFAPNYAYIQTDGEMKAEAEAAALALCSVLAVPAITEAAAQGILFAWAFGESVIDIRSLLKGHKVPLIKSKESWQLQLSALLTLGTDTDYTEGMDAEGGLAYNEYLRMLLFLGSRNQTGVRALDLIEQTLRKEKGLDFFRADLCISRMEIQSACPLRRGITYTFQTYFGYN